MLRSFRIALVFVFCGFAGCSAERPQPGTITLATTTSTQDSGLLEALLPAFERESGVQVKVVAVGSGQALELGRRGDADVLLTHSPAAETKFMDEGWGSKRLAVMHNDFVIVGPEADKAAIRKSSSAVEAFQKIAEAGGDFISRGDESGTHLKEMSVWKESGVDPRGSWYIRAGSGMAQALRMAHEKKAYVLCDRGTYLALRGEVELIVLLEGDERLRNNYSVITVNRERHAHVNQDAAVRFARFLVSPSGQKTIGDFGVEKYKQPLFVPDAGL